MFAHKIKTILNVNFVAMGSGLSTNNSVYKVNFFFFSFFSFFFTHFWDFLYIFVFSHHCCISIIFPHTTFVKQLNNFQFLGTKITYVCPHTSQSSNFMFLSTCYTITFVIWYRVILIHTFYIRYISLSSPLLAHQKTQIIVCMQF